MAPLPRASMVSMIRAHLLISTLAAAACTQAAELDFAEAEAERGLLVAAIPDAVAEAHARPDTGEGATAASGGQPRIFVSRYGQEDERGWGDGTARCPFEVEATGFPAVSEDGSTVAWFTAETLSSSDGEDEIVTLAWLDVERDANDESLVIVDGDEISEDEDAAGSRCRILWRRARVRASKANARLAGSTWRAMTHLPVGLDPRHVYDEAYEDDDVLGDDDEEYAAALASRRQRVQAIYLHGQAILRVPGVKVLERRTARWDDPGIDPDDPCIFSAYPAEIFADRETGVAVAEVAQVADPCFCYAATTYRRIDLSPATYEEILRRNPGGDEAPTAEDTALSVDERG
jgi:hypothetical protein